VYAVVFGIEFASLAGSYPAAREATGARTEARRRAVSVAPMRPDAVGELLAAASRRAGLDPAIRPHQLRHAFASNVADSGGGIDVVADLLGHASVSSSQVYSHPDPSRLRAAVDAVPSPREQAGVMS
jgi:site-specific recombinase XerD